MAYWCEDYVDEIDKVIGWHCSACDLPLETEDKTPYCPYCGAKMENADYNN